MAGATETPTWKGLAARVDSLEVKVARLEHAAQEQAVAVAHDLAAKRAAPLGAMHEEYRTIRFDVREALDAYVFDRKEPGDFLRAVLANDLVDAVCRADATNLRTIRAIVHYVYNELPSHTWGSRARVIAWLKEGALPGTE